MAIEKSQLKFVKSERSGELISFVSRRSQNGKLNGVRENSRFGKQICVLAEHLKGQIEPDVLYEVELKPMHKANGYVVVSAKPVLSVAKVETMIIPKVTYKVTITFDNKYKTFYFDPKDGKSKKSRTCEGVLSVLRSRVDIENLDQVIKDFLQQAKALIWRMELDGFIYTGKRVSELQ